MIPEKYGDARDGLQVGANDMTYKKMIQQEKRDKKKKKFKKNRSKDDGDEEKRKGSKFDVNTADQRFTAMYDDSSYAIDPTDPRYKTTDNMNKIMKEKATRRRAAVVQQERSGSSTSSGGVVTVDANQAHRQRTKPSVPEGMKAGKNSTTESLVETLKRKHEEMKIKTKNKTKQTEGARSKKKRRQ